MRIFVLITLCSFCLIDANPLEIIYANKDHFIKMGECYNYGLPADSFKCNKNKAPKSFYLSSFDSSFSAWEANKAIVLNEFITRTVELSMVFYEYNKFVFDSLTIMVLAELLDYPFIKLKTEPYMDNPGLVGYGPPTTGNWNHDALYYLTYCTYFGNLKKFGKEIRNHLQNCPESEHAKTALLALSNVSIETGQKLLSEHDSLVHVAGNRMQEWPLWVRSRLGDKKAEETIVKRLKQVYKIPNPERGYSEGITIADDALFAQTDSTLFYLFKLFEKDFYTTDIKNRGENTEFCRSLQDKLIFLVARLFPDNALFQHRLRQITNPREWCDLKSQEQYFIEFKKVIKDSYGIEINYTGFTPYFEKICDKSNYGKYCK